MRLESIARCAAVVLLASACAERERTAAQAPASPPASSAASAPAAEPAAAVAEPTASSAAGVTFSPSSVLLNYRYRTMEIRGTLSKGTGPAPERVWVWAYFINPGEGVGGSRSDEPIEVVNPFAHGESAVITARGRFHWATNPDAPRSGYFARTNVSATSADDARIPSSMRDYGTAGAIPVTTKH